MPDLRRRDHLQHAVGHPQTRAQDRDDRHRAGDQPGFRQGQRGLDRGFQGGGVGHRFISEEHRGHADEAAELGGRSLLVANRREVAQDERMRGGIHGRHGLAPEEGSNRSDEGWQGSNQPGRGRAILRRYYTIGGREERTVSKFSGLIAGIIAIQRNIHCRRMDKHPELDFADQPRSPDISEEFDQSKPGRHREPRGHPYGSLNPLSSARPFPTLAHRQSRHCSKLAL